MPSVLKIRCCFSGYKAALAEERAEQLVGALARQGIDAKLRVVGLAYPLVRILGAVRDEQQQTGGRQAFDQGVQERLGLAVGPVEIFDEEERRLLTLPEQQALEGAQRPISSRRVEHVPGGIRDGHVEQREGQQVRRGVVRVRIRPGQLLTDGRPSSRASIRQYAFSRSMAGP